MKKTILKLSFIAAVAVAAGYTAYSQSQKAEALSDLALENVEALAGGEGGGGSYDCCNTCSGAFCGTFTPDGSSSSIKVYYR